MTTPTIALVIPADTGSEVYTTTIHGLQHLVGGPSDHHGNDTDAPTTIATHFDSTPQHLRTLPAPGHRRNLSPAGGRPHHAPIAGRILSHTSQKRGLEDRPKVSPMTSAPLTLQSLSVLYWLTQQPSGEHTVPEDVCPTELQPAVHDELSHAGVVVNERAAGGPPTFAIEPRQLLTARNAAASYRQATLQRHILEQLKKTPDQLDILGFLATLEIHGPTATEEELVEAERALKANDLVTGMDLGGDHPLNHPEITPAGEAVLRSPHAPEDALRSSQQGTSSNHYGDVNTLTQLGSGNASLVNMPGQHNTAHVQQSTQTGNPDLSEALDRITVELQQHAPEHAERIGAQLDLIRQMDQDDADPGMLRKLLGGISNGLGQALGQRAPELIDMALNTLPPA